MARCRGKKKAFDRLVVRVGIDCNPRMEFIFKRSSRMFELIPGRKAFVSKVMDCLVNDYKLSVSQDISLVPARELNDILNLVFHTSKCADEAAIEVAIKVHKEMKSNNLNEDANRLKDRVINALGYFKGREGIGEIKAESLKEKINAMA